MHPNNSLFKQRGMTFSGLVFVLMVVGFVVLMALKLIPVYMENGNIMKSVQQLKNLEGVETMSAPQVKASMDQLLYLNDVGQHIFTEYDNYFLFKASEKGGKVMIVEYDREVPLFANLFILARFNETVEFQ